MFQRCLTYAGGLGALVVGHPQEPALSDGRLHDHGPVRQRARPARRWRRSPSGSGSSATWRWSRRPAPATTPTRSRPPRACRRSRRAKAAGLPVTAGVSIHHLTLNELDVGDYRTFFKLTPPLRSEDDRMAMVQALADGLIDVVGSFHTPQDEEEKRLPFEEAASGAVGLETLLPAAMQLYHAGHLTLPALWRALALNPARLLGLAAGRLAAGAPADLVLFDPDAPFVLDRATLRSKSKNTPYDLRRMQGRVLRTWVGGREVFAREAGMTAGPDLRARLPGRLDPVRRADHPRAGPRRPARDRLGQHRRDQRAAHRQQGRGGGDADARRRQGRGGGAGRPGGRRARTRRCSRASRPSSAISFRSGSGFRGGKGVATFLGVMLALAWPVGLAACADLAGDGVRRPRSRRSRRWSRRRRRRSGWRCSGRGRRSGSALALAALIFLRHRANIAPAARRRPSRGSACGGRERRFAWRITVIHQARR